MGAVSCFFILFLFSDFEVMSKMFIFLYSDDDANDIRQRTGDNNAVGGATGSGSQIGQNPFLDIPESANAIEYKKGYVMRKCCYDSNYKKSKYRLF